MKKLYLYVLLAISIIGIPILSYGKIRALHRPNIIFIILDAARADHFSCYGYPKNTTPCIDKIGRNGAVFQNHFSQGAFTAVSLPSIFFSRYLTLKIIEDDAWLWGIRQVRPEDILKQFDSEQILLPSILSSNGYHTVLLSTHNFFQPKTYFVNHFNSHLLQKRKFRKALAERTFVSKIASLLKENGRERFFIYWHIMFPHLLYPANIENKDFFPGIDAQTILNVRSKIINRKNDSTDIFNDEEIRCLKGLYDSNLRYADTLVGILYEKLKAIGLINKTLIIITADHGENLGDHGLLTHGGPPWDSLIKVPLIVSYPPLIPKETKVKGLTESIDIMPTILDICGIKLPNGKSLDGISLLKYLHHPEQGKEFVLTNNSIRTIKYKYIFDKDLLYNLQQDPNEENNVAEKELAIKEKLISTFGQTIEPYRKRYENSIRKNPPDYPFYFGISDFNIAPLESIDSCDVDNYYAPFSPLYAPFSPLTERPTNKPWLLNTHKHNGKIFRVPDTGLSPPLILRIALPNGTYRIYILVESTKKIIYSPDHFGLKYRFSMEAPFNYPGGISLFRSEGEDYFYYYLYLGENIIEDNKFSFQIDFQPPDKNLYAIQHVKFVPSALINNDAQQNRLKENEKFKRKKEDLKSLGYL